MEESLLPDPLPSNEKKLTRGRVLCGGLLNMIIGAAGAGLLSFPFAVAQQGLVVTVLFTCFFAVLNVLTLSILVRVGIALAPRLRHHHSFDALLGAVFGGWGRWLAAGSIFVGCLGSMIAFLIVIADMGEPAMQSFMPECGGSGDGGGKGVLCWMFAGRSGLTLCFSVLVLLPLMSLERLDALAHSSALGVVSVVAVAVVIYIRSAEALSNHLPAFRSHESPSLAVPSFSLALGIPIAVFALGNHLQLIPVLADIARNTPIGFHYSSSSSSSSTSSPSPSPSPSSPSPSTSTSASIQGMESGGVGGGGEGGGGEEGGGGGMLLEYRFGKGGVLFNGVVLWGSAVACTVLYLSTGIAGYFLFGSHVDGDVLLSFPTSDVLADVAKLLLMIHIVFAFPVVAFPSREAFLSLLHTTLPSHLHPPPFLARVGIAAAQLAACGVVAVLEPSVVVYFGLLGATTSATQIYGFPAALLLRLAALKERVLEEERTGVEGGPDAPTLWEREWVRRDEEGVWGWRYKGVCAPEAPTHLRILAATIILIGLAIMGLGTYTTIDQNFLQHS